MSFASFAGSFKSGNCRAVIAPDNLMETADPEQGLSLAAQVAKHLVELHRTLEQRQLPRVLPQLPGIRVALFPAAVSRARRIGLVYRACTPQPCSHRPVRMACWRPADVSPGSLGKGSFSPCCTR
jgi:antitoxin component of MazEF toxin-antitoxin module